MNDSLKDIVRSFIKRPAAVVMARLYHKSSGQQVGVANIHVSWDKLRFPALQALQAISTLNELIKMVGGPDVPHVFCGDFNSTPDHPTYQLLCDGQLSTNMMSNIKEFTANVFPQATEMTKYVAKELVTLLPGTFQHDSQLASAYNTVMGQEPPITNCDDACQDYLAELCLDYIWFSRNSLEVVGALQTPPSEAILKHYSLPSVLFPSDHIPLKAEFVFK